MLGRGAMRFAIVGLSVLLQGASLLVPSAARAAPSPPADEPTTEAGASSSRPAGARFLLGALMLAHVRRETSLDKEPGTLAPGVALAVGWRLLDAWEVEATARGAHYDEPGMWSARRTTLLSAGGRARWFIAPSAGVSPFVDFGLDVLVLAVDSASGIGPSAHVGAGVELFHDHAHHRLRLVLGADVPAFAVTYPQAALGCEGCASFSTGRPLYLVPATLAATWTF